MHGSHPVADHNNLCLAEIDLADAEGRPAVRPAGGPSVQGPEAR